MLGEWRLSSVKSGPVHASGVARDVEQQCSTPLCRFDPRFAHGGCLVEVRSNRLSSEKRHTNHDQPTVTAGRKFSQLLKKIDISILRNCALKEFSHLVTRHSRNTRIDSRESSATSGQRFRVALSIWPSILLACPAWRREGAWITKSLRLAEGPDDAPGLFQYCRQAARDDAVDQGARCGAKPLRQLLNPDLPWALPLLLS
jgi:hypothetical protein